jgi:AAA domain
MPELSPHEPSIAGADAGGRKVVAHEARGAQPFAVISAAVDAELAAAKLDARLIILGRAAARHTLVDAGEMSLDEAFSDLVPAFLDLCGNPVSAMCNTCGQSPCINQSFCALSRAEDARRRRQLQKRDERIPAATVSRGGEWPCDEGSAPVGNVIIFNAEDGADDTVVPRLIGAGADLKRVHIVSAVLQDDGKGRRTFNLQADLDLLEMKIAEIGDVALVIIDPISSYMGKTDTHKNAEVRGALEPLSEMADRLKVAILSITHFSKTGASNNSKALHRFIGSIAFVGAPRAAFAVIEDADNEGRILFLHAKNNMAAKCQGLAYRLVQTLVGDPEQTIVASYVVWDNKPVTVSADEALRANDDGVDRKAATEAEEFLRDKLSKGPIPAKEGEAHAQALGIAPRTLKRARKRLGVIAAKSGMQEGWVWRLPAEEGQETPKGAIKDFWPPSTDLAPFEEGQDSGRGPKPNVGPLRPSLAPFGSAPANQKSTIAPASDPWTDYPELPASLRRAPPAVNGRAPALGPPGDSLDDFQ